MVLVFEKQTPKPVQVIKKHNRGGTERDRGTHAFCSLEARERMGEGRGVEEKRREFTTT